MITVKRVVYTTNSFTVETDERKLFPSDLKDQNAVYIRGDKLRYDPVLRKWFKTVS